MGSALDSILSAWNYCFEWLEEF